MTMQEAGERAEQMLDKTFTAIRPGVQAMPGPSDDSICADFKNDSTGMGSVTRRRSVVTIVSAERRGSFLGIVERHWKESGYQITSVREHKEMPAIYAAGPGDFRVSLSFGYQGQAFFSVTSPCVTESEVTEPPRPPIPPEARAAEGMPYLHSEFWSARTPVAPGK
ncbi:hypothetical protein [Streptomyces sp. NPDC047097]|uniref:hypothetical protein n=1 Tax=Streptomyces sp. NPDC047097 TaxID=3155260 RepID=UPI0033BFC071